MTDKTGSLGTYVRLFKGLDRKAVAELAVTLAADSEIPAKAEVSQAAVLVSFGQAMGWTKALGTAPGSPNETGAGVGESLEAAPADIDAGTDADLLCTPCANGGHEQCWERRGIARCGGECFNADAALRRALASKDTLRAMVDQRNALIATVRRYVDEAGPSMEADLRRALDGAFLYPPGYEFIPLTHEEAWEEMQRLGTEAYRAQDRVAFVREMCALRAQSTPLVTVEQVLAWLDGSRCMHVAPDPGEGP